MCRGARGKAGSELDEARHLECESPIDDRDLVISVHKGLEPMWTVRARPMAARPLPEPDRGVEVASVEIREHAACGDGVASTADRIVLELTYRENGAGLPDQIILKTLLLHPALRLGLPAILSLSSVVSALERVPWVTATVVCFFHGKHDGGIVIEDR